MPDLSGDIEIAAPVSVVYRYVADWRNTPKYVRGLVRWQPVDHARVSGPGARFETSLKAGPVTIRGAVEIVEQVPNALVVVKSYKGPKLTNQWRFSRAGRRTRVELTNAFELPGGATGRLLALFLQSQAQKDLEGSLEDLKSQVEEARAPKA